MDFLDSLALPQSHEHLILLKYLLGLTFTLFVPFLSVLIGASLFSIILKRKNAKENDNKYIRLARDLINIATFKRSAVYALGIVPLISAIFCYIQLLQNSSASVVVFLILAFFTFIIGVVLLNTYKNSFNLKTIFDEVGEGQFNFKQSETKAAFDDYKKEAVLKYAHTDSWSLLFFVLTALFFVSAIEHASNSAMWGSNYSIISTIFSLSTFTHLIYILIVSSAVTLIAGLFYYYGIKKSEDIDPEYIKFARGYTVSRALVLTIILPVFVLINVLLIPQSALAYYLFLATLFLLVSLLVLATFLYVMMKDESSNYTKILVVLVVLIFVFANAKDQIAFSTTSQVQLANLEANFIKYEESFKESLGMATVTISGEDIYNGKCIACHQFDRKLVGPPYNDVLPKYEGKKDQLVQFIMNPQKINPDYPSMPNQGLKPKEAEAIADYIIATYKK